MQQNKKIIPPYAAILGYSGVIPFATAAALVTLGSAGMRQVALDGFLIYAAVILSFLGGIRWGAASTAANDPSSSLAFSILPSLWAALFLWWPTDEVAAMGFMCGFVLMGLADWFCPGLNVPSWMRLLRIRLTLAVVGCHLLVIAAV